MTSASLNRGILFGSACLLLLIGPSAACDRTSKTKAPPKETPPSAATTPVTPPPPSTPPPPNPGDLPAPADVKAPPADAEKTASGLASKVLTKGTGKEHPTAADSVKVHYTGWTTDGRMFDSSVKRGQPARFPLGNVIKGWTEGLQLMVVGEKRRFWIPAGLAYGENTRRRPPVGHAGVRRRAARHHRRAQGLPRTSRRRPKSAKKTKSGIAYHVLKKGTGKEHPKADSNVEVHYSGWTTDGKMFDSSVTRGKPATFPLNGVIPGWTEGVQLMVVGEKTRFWIPGNLAYDNSPRPGAPKGTLVFDIELLSIK